LPNINQTFWIKCLIAKINDNNNNNIVVSDCRFQNEVDELLHVRASIIKIERNNSHSQSMQDLHCSEKDISYINNYNHIIYNDLDKKYLFKQIDEIINT
jgi:hypothetical protein